MATEKNKELPRYLREAEKGLIKKEKKEHPAKRAVHHVKRAVRAVRQARAARRAEKAAKQAARRERRAAGGKVTLRERWDDLTQGPAGMLIYVILGILIALAVNEGLKPILMTDTPVVAVFSNSMVPTYDKGDMIIVQGGTNISVGDIVVYDASGYKYPIIHRILNVTANGVVTKGDHNLSPDPWVTPLSKVHGKAIFRIPYLGWVKVGTYELFGLV